jgi:signal peptidase
MEPAFQRGDILFLDNTPTHAAVGDIVVFKIAGRDVPIVHRVLWLHEHSAASAATGAGAAALSASAGTTSGAGEIDYLTKGDNNQMNDRGLYAPGQLWLRRSEILGVAKASVPYVGMVTILLNDYPWLKYALLGLMGVFVLTAKEG